MTNLQSELYSAFDTADRSPETEFVRWLASSYGVSEPLRILDVGCGPGGMLPEFARLGWGVVGMEPDSDYFAQAAQVAEAFANVTMKAGGFADISGGGEFDIVVAINGPFSYLLRIEDRIDALSRMFRVLKPKGILFLDMANFLWILKNYRAPGESTARVRGRVVKRVPHLSLDFHDNIWTHVDEFFLDDPSKGRLKVTKIHRFGIMGLSELLYFIRDRGFIDIRTYNSFRSRASERLTGSRLMISAQKPE